VPVGSEEAFKRELERLRPFHLAIELPYGLNTLDPESPHRQVSSTRLSSLVRHAFPALRARYGGSLAGKAVLDVGCNCGGFAFEAARAGASRVVGIDVVGRYIEQAEFIRNALDIDQAEFSVTGIDQVADLGRFDVILCFGLLYHLEDPIGSMRSLAGVCDDVIVVDTNITAHRFLKKPFWRTNVAAPGRDEGATSAWRSDRPAFQFTPNAPAVEQLARFLGFARVERLPNREPTLDPRYKKGTRATFLASRA
jgi:tRNA (mo5U34)-methyltransferase